MPDLYIVVSPSAEQLPTSVNNGILKRTAAGTAWELVAPASTAGLDVLSTAGAAGTSTSMAPVDHSHKLTETVFRAVAALISAPLVLNSQKIQSLADPAAAQDAATKAYVDAAAAGARDPKDSVRVATTAALPANTPAGSGVGKTLTMNAVGILAVDGTNTALNDRILVKDEAAGQHNGIYKVTTEGTGCVAAVLTRAIEADTSAEVTAGMFCWATEGSTNADSGWLLTTNDPITLDTTVLGFTQVSSLGQITAGAGLTKTGSTIDVIANADASIAVNANDIQVGVLATDAQHGVRGGGTQHAAATSGANGFMPAADKAKLDNITATARDTASTTDGNQLLRTIYTPPSSSGGNIAVSIAGIRSDGNQVAAYSCRLCWRKTAGGVITQVGSTNVQILGEDDVNWDGTIDTASGAVRWKVTGAAAITVNWVGSAIVEYVTY